MRVLFVCTGNSCRSPMAEAYFAHRCRLANRRDIEAVSAGTSAWSGAAASEAAIETMREYNIDLENFRSTALTVDLIRASDLIVAMTESHRQAILRAVPEAKDKTKLLLEYETASDGDDVPDPYGGSVNAYAAVFRRMKHALDRLADEILKK